MSLSRRIFAILMKSPEEEMIFISQSDRLLMPSIYERNSAPLPCVRLRTLRIACHFLL